MGNNFSEYWPNANNAPIWLRDYPRMVSHHPRGVDKMNLSIPFFIETDALSEADRRISSFSAGELPKINNLGLPIVSVGKISQA